MKRNESPAAFPVFSMTAFTVLAHWKAFSASRFRVTGGEHDCQGQGEDESEKSRNENR